MIRDLFGRVVPGLVLLLALAASVTSFTDVVLALERATIWMWLLAFGAGWLSAFALLALGRRFSLVHYSPGTITEAQYWAAEERFRSSASRRQRAEYERLVTIRDATGAVSVSLFLSLLVLAIDFVVDVHLHESPWSKIRNGATAGTTLVALGVALQLVHREHMRRVWMYLANAPDSHRV
ncbi:MAG: hypothetical protein ACM3NQ_18580 [Bacteroidales bacterium]